MNITPLNSDKFAGMENWSTLFPHREGERNEKLLIAKIYNDYKEYLSEFSNPSEKKDAIDDILLRSLRVVIRDNYMEALFLGKIHETATIYKIIELFHEDRGKMVNDIHKFFESGYNQAWRVGAIYLMLIKDCCKKRYYPFDHCVSLSSKEEAIKKLSDFMGYDNQLGYDGEKSINHLGRRQLLAYRIVNNIKKWRENGDGSPHDFEGATLCDYALSLFDAIQKMVKFDQSDASTFFQKKLFCLVHLSYNHELEQSLDLSFLPLDEKEKTSFKKKPLVEERILQERGDNAIVLPEIFRQIVAYVKREKKYLSFTIYHSKKTPHTPKSPGRAKSQTFSKGIGQKKSKDSSSKKTSFLVEKFLIDFFKEPPLPYIYRLVLSNKPSSKENKQAVIVEINRLLNRMDYFTPKKSYSKFIWYLAPVKRHIYDVKQALRENYKAPYIHNSLELLFRGQIEKKQMQALLDDFNQECAVLFHTLRLADIDENAYSYLDRRYQNIEMSEEVKMRVSTYSSEADFSFPQLSKEVKPFTKIDSMPPIKEGFNFDDFPPLHDKRICSLVGIDQSGSSSYSTPSTLSMTIAIDEPRERSRLSMSEKWNFSRLDTISPTTTDMGESSSSSAPMVIEKKLFAIQKFSKDISAVMIYKILTEKKLKQAVEIVQKLLSLSKFSLTKKSNLFLVEAIYATLSSHPISRLKKIFKNLCEADKKTVKKLEKLFDSKNNCANHREYYRTSPLSLIPSCHIYIGDLDKAASMFTGDTKKGEEEKQKDSDEGIKETRERIAEEFYKKKYLLKICHPFLPPKSDIVESFRTAAQEIFIPWDHAFIKSAEESGESVPLSAEKWEEFPLEDKLFYYSKTYKSDWI